MSFIRRIPIQDVARALDLVLGSNGHFRCWYPHLHKNGDRTPSVGIDLRRNKVKCFACDTRPLGPIDLVMEILQLSPAAAASWIAGKFDVPFLNPRKHPSRETKEQRAQYGSEEPIELLVRSGIWSTLNVPTQRLIPVLLIFAVKRSGHPIYDLEMSYAAMGRYSGISSYGSISGALKELYAIGWLMKAVSHGNAGPGQPCGRYVLTPFSDRLRELANSTVQEHKTAIEAEKELRAGLRRNRFKTLQRSQPLPERVITQYDSLYAERSSVQIPAILRVAEIGILSRYGPPFFHPVEQS